MLDYQEQLKLQAFLDGELPQGETAEVAKLLSRDDAAVRLHNELRNTRQAVAASQSIVLLPESREFFWSKVRREIERLDSTATKAPALKGSWLLAWRRLLIPAGAVAALVIVTLVTLGPQPFAPAIVADSESSYDDSGAFTYHDADNHATLVWLSYPAEDDLSKDDPADNVQ
jgi:anti-sigma factor RsiW